MVLEVYLRIRIFDFFLFIVLYILFNYNLEIGK